jgi:hypothetical protein
VKEIIVILAKELEIILSDIHTGLETDPVLIHRLKNLIRKQGVLTSKHRKVLTLAEINEPQTKCCFCLTKQFPKASYDSYKTIH